jgi:hypothetical protein
MTIEEAQKAAEDAINNILTRLIATLIAMDVSPDAGHRAVCTVLGRALGNYAGPAAAAIQAKSGGTASQHLRDILIQICDVAIKSARAGISAWSN